VRPISKTRLTGTRVRRPSSHILLFFASIPLLVFTVGCFGSSPGGGSAALHGAAPFTTPGGSESGPDSGLWGDTTSGPTGIHLGCLPGRHFALVVTLRNHSTSTVTITQVGGPEPAPSIIHRVAVQLRLAPPPSNGDAIVTYLRRWSASPPVPVAIPPGRSVVVQSNFLMGRCDRLGPHQALTLNRAIIVAYRAGEHTGRQEIAQKSTQIILMRGPTIRRCAAPTGATRLVAYDITCSVAERAAVGCHRLPHGTWGTCTAASSSWDCTFTNASKALERCWLASKRQSLNVRWAFPDSVRATAVSGNVVISGGPPPPPGSDQTNDTHPDSHAGIVVSGTTAAGAHAYRLLFANARGHFALALPPGVYTITAVVPGGGSLAGMPHHRITVTPGRPAHVRLTLTVSTY
jgi:hypothetical protein